MKHTGKKIAVLLLSLFVILIAIYDGIYFAKFKYAVLNLNQNNAVRLGAAGTTIDEVTATIQSKIIPSDSLNPYFIEQYVNNVRQSKGLKPLRHNSELTTSAEAKLNDMIARDYFAHTSPQNKQPWDFMTANGYNYVTAGENLAKADYQNEQSVVNAWIDSPEHYTVMTNPSYCDIGVAVHKVRQFQGETSLYVVVMHVGSRRDSEIDAC